MYMGIIIFVENQSIGQRELIMLRPVMMVLLRVTLLLLENRHPISMKKTFLFQTPELLLLLKVIGVDFPGTICFHKHKDRRRLPETHLISGLREGLNHPEYLGSSWFSMVYSFWLSRSTDTGLGFIARKYWVIASYYISSSLLLTGSHLNDYSLPKSTIKLIWCQGQHKSIRSPLIQGKQLSLG